MWFTEGAGPRYARARTLSGAVCGTNLGKETTEERLGPKRELQITEPSEPLGEIELTCQVGMPNRSHQGSLA
jgi:hypothetical protein